ncbi:hypothetical protein IFM89_027933 [Coptis chinensis]|uniref:Neprosin PEP catalytic domain-containing protein n=1 Tax=Coptis chinensis TaxID=261450 RepID=A0A835IFG6_9MAGN|nr:hypothetical protein IFM89_027933 [Coptis chinensis]
MVKIICLPWFGLEALMLLLAMAIVVVSDGGGGMFVSKHKFSEMNKKLKLLNRPAIKSIQSKDGDVIDCVDIYKQPALRNPALRNHTIQMKPSYDPTEVTEHTKEKQNSSTVMVPQIWHRSGSCPEGTVPIRRIKKRDLLRAESLDRFGRKNPTIANERRRNEYPYANKINGSHHIKEKENTAVLLTEGFRYSAAKADINIWNPGVEFDDEFSSAQIWLQNGAYNDYESVESGWIVNPKVYGDRRTRLFAYWTADASHKTGCFDHTCPGFVQTSSLIALGSAFDPVSGSGTYQYTVTLFLHKDPDTGNWWLRYGTDVDIGYFPAELFRALRYQANFVQWGGQVYSSRVGNSPHTATAMGSGSTERSEGWGCFMRQIRIRDNSFELKYPYFVDTYTDEYNCYHAFNFWEYTADPEFFFGGPGRNPLCP